MRARSTSVAAKRNTISCSGVTILRRDALTTVAYDGALFRERAARPVAHGAPCGLLQVVGFPWQYKQSPNRTKIWAVNAVFRKFLNKLMPRIFAPQVRLDVGEKKSAAGATISQAPDMRHSCRHSGIGFSQTLNDDRQATPHLSTRSLRL